MSNVITVNHEDIFHQVKLSCQIPSLIEQVVSRKLIVSTAAELGLKLETSELQEAANGIRLKTKLQKADDTWAWLQKHYLSLDDFEELVYLNFISRKLAEHLFGNKVEPWFAEHQLDYAGAAMYEVVLNDEDLAMELFYLIEEGEITFPEVAHKYIQDKKLCRTGGYRGIVRRRELKPEISAAVFAAKPPEVIKPIVTSKRVHLIFVEELIQPQLDNELRYQIRSDLFGEWVKKKVEEVEVVTKIELGTPVV